MERRLSTHSSDARRRVVEHAEESDIFVEEVEYSVEQVDGLVRALVKDIQSHQLLNYARKAEEPVDFDLFFQRCRSVAVSDHREAIFSQVIDVFRYLGEGDVITIGGESTVLLEVIVQEEKQHPVTLKEATGAAISISFDWLDRCVFYS